jgi:Rhodanese-like domain
MKGENSMKQTFTTLVCGVLCIFFTLTAQAQEVGKGKIPTDQLASSYTNLPWACPIWDVKEALTQLKSDEKVLWVDTRPESFFKKGTVRGAVLFPYNKKEVPDNALTKETLAAALTEAGVSKDGGKIIFFCQGPKCHRSYNATFIAVTDWGYKAENVIWFRAGYPHLLKEIKNNPKLKRKAKKYISNAGVKQL